MNNKSKVSVVILHGWGLKGSTYEKLIKLLEKGHKVYAPDLPGFGDEPLLSNSMNLSDYVEFVKKFLEKKDIKNAILIGHSFGGRIAVKFAFVYPDMVEKLILTGVPVIRHMSFRKKVAAAVALFGKNVTGILPAFVSGLFRKALYRSIGEYDYLKAGGMKKTLTNIVNEDLVEYAKKLKKPTFLIWGEQDSFTPQSDVSEIKNLIKGSKGIVLKGETHSLPYKSPSKFYSEIQSFL